MKHSDRKCLLSNCSSIRQSPRWPRTLVRISTKILSIHPIVVAQRNDEKH